MLSGQNLFIVWTTLAEDRTFQVRQITGNKLPISLNYTSDYYKDVCWNGTLYVAVGQGSNSIAYSSNGTTWTNISTSTSIFSVGKCN